MDVAALILDGGKATRLGGVDKLALVIDGRTILSRLTDVLAPRVGEILISTPRDVPGYRCVRDSQGIGPLAGIAAGLAATDARWLLVVAGDMPHITADLIDAMLVPVHVHVHVHVHVPVHDVPDAVGIRHAGLPEPLLCLLRVETVGPVLSRRLAAQRYKASGLLTDEGLRVTWLDLPDPRPLANINEPDDLPPRRGT